MADVSDKIRDTLIGIYIGMFRAVPGADTLAVMIQQYQSGITLRQIAGTLANTQAQDFATVMPPDLPSFGFAHHLANLLLGNLVSTDAYAWSKNWVNRKIDAGATYAEVIVQAVNGLKAATNPEYFKAKALLLNQIEIGRHFAIDLQQESMSLLEARAIISIVTHIPDSMDLARQYLTAREEGLALTSGTDILTANLFRAFPVYVPGTNNYTNTLQNHDVLTGTGALATINAAFASWDNQGVQVLTPVLHDIPVINFWISGNRMMIMHLDQASGVRNLTISSTVRIDLHGLGTDGLADGNHLKIDASNMSDDLLLFIDAPFTIDNLDVSPSHADLLDLVILAGNGHDSIRISGALAGSINTGGGSNQIVLGSPGSEGRGDMLGISLIHSPSGRVSVSAGNMLATASDEGQEGNEGFDDVRAARISASEDPDSISVVDLQSAQDWDGTERFIWVGASITTGGASDQVNFHSMADGTSIDTGTGSDWVRVNLVNQIVLAADSDGDRQGAVIHMGEGIDVASFEEFESNGHVDTLIFGRDAKLYGAETLEVEVYDWVTVTTLSSLADVDTATPGVQPDTSTNVEGTTYLNLVVKNKIDRATTNNSSEERGMEVDLLRFDSVLESVFLESEERADPYFSEGSLHYGPGSATEFRLHNVRTELVLNLAARDATSAGQTPEGLAINDSLLTLDAQTGTVITNPGARDVTLWLSYDNARGLNDHASIGIFNNIDLDLTLAPTSTDLVGAEASSQDDDYMMIEHLTLTLGGGSYSLNGYGDTGYRAQALKPPAHARDVSSPVETSLSIYISGSNPITVDGVNADTITLNNGVSTHEGEASLILRVDAANNYRITTISGDDVLDLRADVVRADDNETGVDRADHIDTGKGRDVLIISGDNHLGSNNLQTTTPATVFSDNIFATLSGIEEILTDTDHGSTAGIQKITLDAAAANKGLDTLRFTGNDTHTVHMVLGRNYSHTTPSRAPLTLHIDASAHQGDFNLVLDNKALSNDDNKFNQTIHFNIGGESANTGNSLVILDSGDEQQKLDLILTTASQNIDTLLFEGTATAAGEMALTVAKGSIDSITLVDGGAEDESGMETSLDLYLIATGWTQDEGEFRFDAASIADTDNDSTTGGVFIIATFSDAAENFLLGSENRDIVFGSAGSDTIEAGAGGDAVWGAHGSDWLKGGDGADFFLYGAVDESGRLTISAAVDSNLNLNLYDTLADFTSGVEKLVIHLGSKGRVVNLGRFSDNDTSGNPYNSLEGNANAWGPVVGDAFYSTTLQRLVVDVDGNSQARFGDLLLESPLPITAADINYIIASTDNNDIMRPGLGADSLRGFAGADTFVVLGAVTETNRLNYQAAGSAGAVGILGDISYVLAYNELLTTRQEDESIGDLYDGGEGTDFLHAVGTVNLSASILVDIEWVVQHSQVTYALAQLGLAYDSNTNSFTEVAGGISGIALHGNLSHRIVIVDNTGTALSDVLQTKALETFLERPGQQLTVLEGGAGTSLSIGGLTLNGTNSLLEVLADYQDEVLDAISLENPTLFTGHNGLYGFAQLMPEEAHEFFDVGGDYQLVDASASGFVVEFSGQFTPQPLRSNLVGNFDAGSGGDFLDFSAFSWLQGGIEEGGGQAQPFLGILDPFEASDNFSNGVLNGKIALVSSGFSLTGLNKPADIADLFGNPGPFRFNQTGENKALVLAGSSNYEAARLWYIEDTNNNGLITAAEVHLVGQLSLKDGEAITSFNTNNFVFAA